MSMTTPRPRIVYPDSDGMPMSDNTLQFRWIVTIKEGLEILFRADPNVFVAGDLLWYPVEGDPKERTAPDAMVVFGRPKGDRGSYKQWEEDGIAPQVVFEVISPGNRQSELFRKFQFYDRHGVEEYYSYDPDRVILEGWQRRDGHLQDIPELHDWVSPRLGIRFDLSGKELAIIQPHGQPFLTPVELAERAEAAEHRAELERQRAETAEQRAETAEQEIRRLRDYLRERGLEPLA